MGRLWDSFRRAATKPSKADRAVAVTVGPIDVSQSTRTHNEVIVVGTEHYAGMRRIRRAGAVAGVTVRPEPTNKHDRNAVVVYAGRTKVGYLSAFQAKRYRQAITKSTAVDAHARMTGGSLSLFVMIPKAWRRD